MRRAGILLLLLSSSLWLNAELIQIGNGTLVNQSLPIESFRHYSYSQQLYESGQINSAGSISSVAFQYSVVSWNFLANNAAWKVYLGHSSRNSLANWVPADSLSLVFDGTLALEDFSGGLPGQGWLTITCANPFFFNGMENLIVAVDENSPLGGSTSDEFLCTPDAEVRGIVFTSNDVNPDPDEPPPPPVPGFFYARNAYPNLRLEIVSYSLVPWQPQPTDQAAGVPINTSFQWQSDASGFDLYLGDSPQTLELVGQNLSETQWGPPQPFEMFSNYHWQVLAQGDGESHPGPVWSFTTAGEGIGAPQNLSAYYVTDHVQMYWEAPQEGNPVLYRVIRNGVFLAATSLASYQDFEVSSGQVLYYYILAQNHLGEISGPSNNASVHIPELIQDLILSEDFEACLPFSQTVPGWQNLDLDGSATLEWGETQFPGLGAPLAWLVFAPQQTVPPLTGIGAHSGINMLASVAGFPPPNNDWLISPRMQLGNAPSLSFWARSHTADYGLERLRVLISVTGSDPADFIALNAGNWIQVPAEWTQYSFNLSAWQGQSVCLAFNCVSWDAKALYLDDVTIVGEGGYVPVDDDIAVDSGFCVYPNPASGVFTVEQPSKAPFDLAIYDLRGRKLFTAKDLKGFHSAEHALRLAPGIYFLKLESSGKSQLRRLAILR